MSSPSRLSPEQQRERLISLSSALIRGTHSGQVLRQERGPVKGDPALFGRDGIDLQEVERIYSRFKDLLRIRPDLIVAWTTGSTDVEDLHLDQLVQELKQYPLPSSEKLPVNLMMDYMRIRLTGPEDFFVQAVGNLAQLCLEVDHDGTLLQYLLLIYLTFGVQQLSLPRSEEEQIEAGRQLSAQSASAPFDTDPEAYRVMIKKLVNWVEKNSGQRDHAILAQELLEEPEIQSLIPKLKTTPPIRAAFMGHSMTMSLHWSTFGSWNDIASEVMKLINPRFVYCDFQAGGLTARRAVKDWLAATLKYRPTETYIVVAMRTEEDYQCLETIYRELANIGSRIIRVDEVRPWLSLDPEQMKRETALCQKYGGSILEFHPLGCSAPNHEKWPCLDHIHMNTEGHIFYARELLKQWANRSP